MRYRWNQHDMEVARNKVARLLENEVDPAKREFYSSTIDAINQNMFLEFYKYDYKHKPLKNVIVDDANYQVSFNRFVNVICDIQSQVAKVYDELEEVSNREGIMAGLNPEVYDFKRYTHDQAVELTKEFYTDFDKELAKRFMRIYNDRYKSIKYVSSQRQSIFDTFEMSGSCIGIGPIGKNFISINNSNGIYKVGCTVHECGHGIKNLIVPQKTLSDTIDFIGEVESIFPEMVFYHEMGRKIDPFQSAYNMFGYAMTYYETASNIIFQKLIVDRWFKNGCKLDKSVYDSLKADYCMRRQDVMESLYTEVPDDGPYVISFAVVLELLNLYKRDKDKALWIYKQIISAPAHDDPMLTLLKHEDDLCGFEHLATEYSELGQEYKKQLKRKM